MARNPEKGSWNGGRNAREESIKWTKKEKWKGGKRKRYKEGKETRDWKGVGDEKAAESMKKKEKKRGLIEWPWKERLMKKKSDRNRI